MGRLPLLVLPTLAVLMVPTGASSDTRSAALAGISVHTTDVGTVAEVARAGFSVIRNDLVWWEVVRPDGRRDWSKYDPWVAAVRAQGMTPLLIMGYEHQGVPTPPETDEDLEEFASFAAAAARRYRGCLWEVWNEPNVARFWPHPDARAYVGMLARVSAAIHGADPSALVLGGNVGGSAFDLDYLRTAIAAGLLEHADLLSVHPYGAARPEDAADFYRAVRGLMADSERPLVVSEWGYSSAPPASEAEQADKLVRAFIVNAREKIPLTVWYEWQDGGGDGGNAEHRFGLRRADGSPKPAFDSLLDLQPR